MAVGLMDKKLLLKKFWRLSNELYPHLNKRVIITVLIIEMDRRLRRVKITPALNNGTLEGVLLLDLIIDVLLEDREVLNEEGRVRLGAAQLHGEGVDQYQADLAPHHRHREENLHLLRLLQTEDDDIVDQAQILNDDTVYDVIACSLTVLPPCLSLNMSCIIICCLQVGCILEENA
jgi:hypothetical protein